MEGYKFQDKLNPMLHAAACSHEIKVSRWNRRNKTQLLLSIVASFERYLDDNGAIIDPTTCQEKHYSSPSFAYAAAVLVSLGYSAYLRSACLALTHSIDVLVDKQTPDQHPDFFPVLIMQAYEIVAGFVDQVQLDVWKMKLSRIVPEEHYTYVESKMTNHNRIHNWNAIALTGEFLRYKHGMTGDLTWIEAYLHNYQLPRFTKLGLYQDGPIDRPNCPFAYDIVTRYHLELLRLHQYGGEGSEQLFACLDHGAMTNLLFLSPLGEIPPRGRSAQHTWNEAAAASIFTLHANRCMVEQKLVLAGMFQRAAALCFEAVSKWQKDNGELRIVKNYYPECDRHGFEVYSNHSTYNLWAAAALATAVYHANDEIDEKPIPSELGSAFIEADGWFQTVAAYVRGTYIIVQTAANDPYNTAGLVRIHRQGLPAELGPSAGGFKDPFWTQLKEGTIKPISYAPSWRVGNQWHSLSDGIVCEPIEDLFDGIAPDYGGHRAEVKVLLEDKDEVRFEICWLGPFPHVNHIAATYCVREEYIDVQYRVDGEIDQIGADIPCFYFDGRAFSSIEITNNHLLQIQYQDQGIQIEPLDGDSRMSMEETQYATRSGLLKKARLERSSHTIAHRIHMKPVQ